MSNNSQSPTLETYLAQIERELRHLPATARADEMREIESHLQTMIEARGDVAGVLAQFGKPHKVGRDLRRAWERKQPEAWWRAAGILMLAIHFYFTIAYPFMLGFYNYNQGLPADLIPKSEGDQQFPLFILMFTSSYIMGVLSPKRSYLGIVALLLIMSFPTPINQASTSGWGLISLVNIVISAAVGTIFGAYCGRKFVNPTIREKINV